MRIAICDDNKEIVKQIHDYLKEFFQINTYNCVDSIEFCCFFSGEALLQDKREFDIAFLDIEMPGLSGIKAGQELKNKYPDILIFVVTNYNEYLDEAMRLQVFRYLSKPIEKLRLFRNMKDALNIYSNNNTRITIETKQGIYTIRIMDILCIETIGRKTIIHTTDEDKKYTSIYNMQYWLTKLNQQCFFQSHRSFLVNMEHIADFDHFTIHMIDSDIQPYMSRRKYKQFKDAYMFYIENTR